MPICLVCMPAGMASPSWRYALPVMCSQEAEKGDTGMNDRERDELRSKQDKLIELTSSRRSDLHISGHPESPTIEQLSITLFPRWETTIDRLIDHLTARYQGGGHNE